MPETAKRTARVPILGANGRISDDYVPEAIGKGVESAEAAAKRAETAAIGAQGSATAAGQSATQAASSASAAGASATKAQESATAAGNAKTAADTAQKAAEAAKTGAELAATSAADSASKAQQSATAAADSASSVADKFITSAQATTLEPGSQATASVEEQVLTIGVPEGEKGDQGDPGYTPQRGVDYWTAEDVEAIVEDAKTQAVAELAEIGNVPKKTVTDLVAHGEDAYAQKPIEVRVKGKTWVNRWPVLSGTHNGITVATDGTGLVTVTGTAIADADVTADVSGWATGNSYTTMVSATPTGCSAYFEVQKPSGNTSINATTTGATLNVASDATNCVAGVHVTSGTSVNASFRVMLVDGTEAPDFFTPPASIASVETGKLVTSGKNLLSSSTFAGEPSAQGVLNFSLPAGTYTMSCYNAEDWWTGNVNGSMWYIHDADGNFVTHVIMRSPSVGSRSSATFTLPRAGDFTLYTYKIDIAEMVTDIQLELGSTATPYEPPTVTATTLPEVELRSLPNGTCDELVIRADGSCEVERNVTEYEVTGTEKISVGEHSSGQKYASLNGAISSVRNPSMLCDKYACGVYNATTDKYVYIPNPSDMVINDSRFIDLNTAKQILTDEKPVFLFEAASASTEPQSPVTLPVLPAPTFNQYHDADIPSDTSTQYARDINIVLSNLEAVQTALLGGE